MNLRSRLPAFWHQPESVSHFRHEIDQLFDRFTNDLKMPDLLWLRGGFTPRINVSETKATLEITAELPGLTADDVSVTMQGDQLLIAGEKKAERERTDKNDKGEETYHQLERSFGSFRRIMTLPFEIDADKIVADYKDGVLQLSMPKSAARNSKVKKIDIGAKPAETRNAA
ncbi:MAG: Hsp20/alpha crystallin family protein [Hyphomicrobiaceae bacterium]|nr:Hsp20/alpha crystallin family protein [Hyphomicrobiaceae bacterium]